MISLQLNQLRAVSIRLLIPWTGAWLADVDVDLDDSRAVPSGRVSLHIGGATLLGTIDPRASGVFGAKAKARVIGGAAGWDKAVAPRHFHNDAGVLSSAVLSATAAEVGETVVDASPMRLGVDFVRTAGPASRAFAGRDWYVDFAGITHVAARASAPTPSDVELLTWEPNAQRAELAADSIVTPGMTISDAHLGVSTTVRDVEQTFSTEGARATAWCGASLGTRLIGALASFVREASGIAYARPYRYRVVSQEAADGRLTLQAVSPATGVPDALAISIWPGMSGVGAMVTPGSEVLVDFVAGDPGQPVVRSFDSEKPIELDLDATTRVVVGAGLQPVALATSVLSAISALQTEVTALHTITGIIMNHLASPPTDPEKPHLADANTAITTGTTAVSNATSTAASIKLFSE